MKRKFYFGIALLSLFFSVCLKSNAQSPDWLWAKSIGGLSSDAARAITVDPESGDVFSTGLFIGTVDFDPGIGLFNLESIGSQGMFISKLDGAGNFIWAKTIDGLGSVWSYSIVLDPDSKDIYISGGFNGTVDFDPGIEIFNLTATGTSDMFITKLDGSGNFIWAKSMGGPDAVYVLSMALDHIGGGVYTTGYFYGTIDLDPGAGNFSLKSKGDTDIFISKLDDSGNFVWALGFGGSKSDVSRSIAIDQGSGDVYTTGWFSGKVDFDPGQNSYNISSFGRFDIFISKINSSGNFVWGKQLGGAGEKDGSGASIAIDPGSGDIYTTGYFEGTADFDPDKGIVNLTSAGLRDIFISKLDSTGNFVWAKAMGGTGVDVGSSIVIDPSGNGGVCIAGNFHPTADFDPGLDIFNLTSIGSYDIFISKLDGSGHFVWAKALGGVKGEVAGYLALDVLGNVYVTGFFNGPALPFGSTTLTNTGDYDIFVAKLNVSLPVSVFDIHKEQVDIYPNPVKDQLNIKINQDDVPGLKATLFNLNGDVVFSSTSNKSHEFTIDVSALPPAIYYIELYFGENRLVKQVMKVQD